MGTQSEVFLLKFFGWGSNVFASLIIKFQQFSFPFLCFIISFPSRCSFSQFSDLLYCYCFYLVLVCFKKCYSTSSIPKNYLSFVISPFGVSPPLSNFHLFRDAQSKRKKGKRIALFLRFRSRARPGACDGVLFLVLLYDSLAFCLALASTVLKLFFCFGPLQQCIENVIDCLVASFEKRESTLPSFPTLR